jgi:hypothetical protein
MNAGLALYHIQIVRRTSRSAGSPRSTPPCTPRASPVAPALRVPVQSACNPSASPVRLHNSCRGRSEVRLTSGRPAGSESARTLLGPGRRHELCRGAGRVTRDADLARRLLAPTGWHGLCLPRPATACQRLPKRNCPARPLAGVLSHCFCLPHPTY